MWCDRCKINSTYIKEYEEEFTIKGKIIKVKSNRRFCKKCNKLVYDLELDEETICKAYKLYNEQYGIPCDKIIELRKNLNLSQELFAKIIGCAKKTLISYEKGTAIPNENYIIIFNSLLDNPSIIDALIESNKYNFTEKEYNKIKSKIFNFISSNSFSFFDENDKGLNEYNGYTKFNLNKVINMILYFAKKGVLKTKLMKEMFYADFINYRETGASITGLKYAKLPFGPVPDDKDMILAQCAIDNYIEITEEYNNEYVKYNIKTIEEFNQNIFDDYELKTLEKVEKYFSKFKSKQIADFSHVEKGYVETDYSKNISYKYAFDIERL